MRRTVGVIVGAATALALAGTAGATAWAMTGRDQSRVVGEWRQPKADPAARTAGSAGNGAVGAPRAPAAAAPVATAAGDTVHRAEGGTATTGRTTVGVIENLNRLIRYEG